MYYVNNNITTAYHSKSMHYNSLGGVWIQKFMSTE